jgi:hypothetical protein
VGDTLYFIGTGNTDWSDTGSWSDSSGGSPSGVYPTGDLGAVFDGGGLGVCTIRSGDAYSLDVRNTYNGQIRIVGDAYFNQLHLTGTGQIYGDNLHCYIDSGSEVSITGAPFNDISFLYLDFTGTTGTIKGPHLNSSKVKCEFTQTGNYTMGTTYDVRWDTLYLNDNTGGASVDFSPVTHYLDGNLIISGNNTNITNTGNINCTGIANQIVDMENATGVSFGKIVYNKDAGKVTLNSATGTIKGDLYDLVVT